MKLEFVYEDDGRTGEYNGDANTNQCFHGNTNPVKLMNQF